MAGGGVPRRRPRTGAAGFAASRQGDRSGRKRLRARLRTDRGARGRHRDARHEAGRWDHHRGPLELPCRARGAGREVLLSRTQGGMVSYTFAGNEFVLRRPAIYHLPSADRQRSRRRSRISSASSGWAPAATPAAWTTCSSRSTTARSRARTRMSSPPRSAPR